VYLRNALPLKENFILDALLEADPPKPCYRVMMFMAIRE
jgi:hypothetical protein